MNTVKANNTNNKQNLVMLIVASVITISITILNLI